MKKIIINSTFIMVIVIAIASCTKYDTAINGIANTENAGLASATLNNRIVAGFVVDKNTLPTTPISLFPIGFNFFRKTLTYDTVTTANKPPAYKAGDVITILGFMKGDDYAISKRKINVSLYKAPTAFITPANPPSVINVMQNAEDRYRSYQPTATGVTAADTTFTLASIAPYNIAPFSVINAANESVGGINYNTYLVQLTFTIPTPTATKWIPGQVFSINFNAGVSAGDAGNVNWIYAFKIK